MFDLIIGNPPYQKDGNNTRKAPIYHAFMEQAFRMGKTVILITPARFLYDSSHTPGKWSRKVLADKHFKVLQYEADGAGIFPDTEIKGGLAITCRKENAIFKPVNNFVPHLALASILMKIKGTKSMASIVSCRGLYRFTEKFFQDDPGRLQTMPHGSGNMLTSRVFSLFPQVFSSKRTLGDIPIYGRVSGKRVLRYLQNVYLRENVWLHKYNVMAPEACGRGRFGECLKGLAILPPGSGHTDTFLSIGRFTQENEALNCLKYIQSKFCRALLGAGRPSHHLSARCWRFAPIQNFCEVSDIDWSQADIDCQLYAKYRLTRKEMAFIENNVAAC